MPTSALPVWQSLIHMCWEVRPRRILDVGPGHGKAGILLREYIGTERRGNGPIQLVDAIEAEPRYIEAFPWLTAVYDNVHRGDVTTRGTAMLGFYDLVLFADSIEHIDKPDALALLDRIPGRVVLSTPVDYFDNPEADMGWPTERHRSHWTADDFADRAEMIVVQHGGLLVRLGPKEEA